MKKTASKAPLSALPKQLFCGFMNEYSGKTRPVILRASGDLHLFIIEWRQLILRLGRASPPALS
jgi:hypothetical protein